MQHEIQRAFEVSHRNLTTVQATWDEENPLNVRVEDDENAPYDYLGRVEDATRGSLNYARDLMNNGLPSVAVTEAEDAIRLAPTPELFAESLKLRLEIAHQMGDAKKVIELRRELRQGFAVAREAMGVGHSALESDDLSRAKTQSREEETSPASDRGGEGRVSHSTQSPTHNANLSTLPLVWHAPLLDPSGYADEARHFLFSLASQSKTGEPPAAREIRWSDKITPLPPQRQRLLQMALTRPAPKDPIHVWHILAPHFGEEPGARANIGRTMYETDRLPAGWAEACNRMDAVWVPSAFNVETFAFAGVERDKLRIVPGAIDLTPYRNDLKPLPIEGAKGYTFLSLFDWTLRKGWDVLIRAYVEEFKASEDVSLVLKTHSSLGYTTEQIVTQVSDYLTGTLNINPETCPDIVFETATISDAQMPNLYHAADCYVSPTRGEGWGRPLMEAMAMAVPVIATNWSGQTAFLTPENSLLLDYTLVDVPETAFRETPTYTGHRWAEPSVGHLRELMRRAFTDRDSTKTVGTKGRAHLEANFTYPHVARIIANEIERLG